MDEDKKVLLCLFVRLDENEKVLFCLFVRLDEDEKVLFCLFVRLDEDEKVLFCLFVRLDEDEKVLRPDELLYRCVHYINQTHDKVRYFLTEAFEIFRSWFLSKRIFLLIILEILKLIILLTNCFFFITN